MTVQPRPPAFAEAIERLRGLVSAPGEDMAVIAACDRLHELIDRQGEALCAGGSAAARRWRRLRLQADDLEEEIAAMPVRGLAGRRAVAEVALRLVPKVPRLMVLARASLLNQSRLGLGEDDAQAEAPLLAMLREASIRRFADPPGDVAALIARAAALPAATVTGRQAKARALLDLLLVPRTAEGIEAELARSLARDILGEVAL